MFNAVVQVAAVQLQLGFTGTAAGTTAAPAAAALAAEGFTQALQTGQLVAQGGQFGLQLALIGGSAGTENFQNQHRAVQHFHLQSGGQGPQLVQAAGHIVLALVQRQQHDGQFLAVLLFLGRGAKVQIDRILAHRSSFTRW